MHTHQQPPSHGKDANAKSTSEQSEDEPHDVGSDQPSRVQVLSKYARQKRAKLRRAALEPNLSHSRFKDSFSKSKAPDFLKQKFRNLK